MNELVAVVHVLSVELLLIGEVLVLIELVTVVYTFWQIEFILVVLVRADGMRCISVRNYEWLQRHYPDVNLYGMNYLRVLLEGDLVHEELLLIIHLLREGV